MVRRRLRQVSRDSDVTVAVETFGGKDRVFRPREIIRAGVPMTLDTAHIADNWRIQEILRTYWRGISVVHLSARAGNYWASVADAPLSDDGRKEHHLPLDPFCIDVVRTLVGLGWSGTIVLEYLPWYHYRLRDDVKLVGQALVRDVVAEELPLPCDRYRGEKTMYGHNAPSPYDHTA